MVKHVKRGKHGKKLSVKRKGSAKKRVSKKKTPMALGNSSVSEIVERCIKKAPEDLKAEYNKLDTPGKDAIKAELKIEAEKLKKKEYSDTELDKALDVVLAYELDM